LIEQYHEFLPNNMCLMALKIGNFWKFLCPPPPLIVSSFENYFRAKLFIIDCLQLTNTLNKNSFMTQFYCYYIFWTFLQKILLVERSKTNAFVIYHYMEVFACSKQSFCTITVILIYIWIIEIINIWWYVCSHLKRVFYAKLSWSF